MGRSGLSVMDVVGDALGFALQRYGAVLRIAWLPVVLLLGVQYLLGRLGFIDPATVFAPHFRFEAGWITKFVSSLQGLEYLGQGLEPQQLHQLLVYLALMAGAALLQAAYMVPLIRMAANGGVPTHRSAHLAIGFRPLKFIVASAASFAGILLLVAYFVRFAGVFVNDSVRTLLAKKHFVFEEGSLHALEAEPVHGGLSHIVDAVDQFLFGLGINIGAVDLVVLIPAAVLAAYLILRLIAYPYLVAAAQPGEGGALSRALRLSAGRRFFSIAAIVLVFVLIGAVSAFATFFTVGIIYGLTVAGSELVIRGYDNMLPDAEAGPVIRGIVTVLFVGASLAFTVLMAAFQAGIGGALVRRARSLG